MLDAVLGGEIGRGFGGGIPDEEVVGGHIERADNGALELAAAGRIAVGVGGEIEE
jgi:hypothetical protein